MAIDSLSMGCSWVWLFIHTVWPKLVHLDYWLNWLSSHAAITEPEIQSLYILRLVLPPIVHVRAIVLCGDLWWWSGWNPSQRTTEAAKSYFSVLFSLFGSIAVSCDVTCSRRSEWSHWDLRRHNWSNLKRPRQVIWPVSSHLPSSLCVFC